jgi:hypothetical protein
MTLWIHTTKKGKKKVLPPWSTSRSNRIQTTNKFSKGVAFKKKTMHKHRRRPIHDFLGFHPKDSPSFQNNVFGKPLPDTTNEDQTLSFHPESEDFILKSPLKLNLRLLLQVINH